MHAYRHDPYMRPFLFLLFLVVMGKVAAQSIRTDEWKRLIPSGNLPAEIHVQRANNNLDIALYNGRYYVAYRTAP